MKSNKESSKNEEEKKDRSRTSYSELPNEDESVPATKSNRRESKTAKDLKESWMFRRNKTTKEKNDPERFSGDGINFKAKIIGIESVFDARGNRMCQEALQNLKAAVKSSGEHKQRILLNISLLGIRIKDEKSGEVLHHHPVHKISFISQDVGDSRAFGYVFGCPQTGHQFFGIKSEKPAAHIVCALRDLFHTALELKKKEIEKAMEQQNEDEQGDQEQREVNGRKEETSPDSAAKIVENGEKVSRESLHSEQGTVNGIESPNENSEIPLAENSSSFSCTVDNLLDLRFEMDSLQQGITQMDNSMASATSFGFGMSFSEDNNSLSSMGSFPATPRKQLNRVSSLYQETLSVSSRSSSTSDYTMSAQDSVTENFSSLKAAALSAAPVPPAPLELPPPPPPPPVVEDKYAVFYEIDNLPSVFDNPSLVQSTATYFGENVASEDTVGRNDLSEIPTGHEGGSPEDGKSDESSSFVELDPLGGQPFVEKQNFFQDVKSPPKKVLRDLTGESCDTYAASAVNVLSDTHLYRSDSSGLQEAGTNPFTSPARSPPKLPPKRYNAVASPPPPPPVAAPRPSSDECVGYGARNPFNPFTSKDEYPDFPPPDTAPPPPPPPRLPTKEAEPPTVASPPPPPRPPSRTSVAPTPPRPRRKVSLGTTNNAWFSFDQDATSSSTGVNSSWTEPPLSPPLPLPSRKIAGSGRYESPVHKSFSASNSPAAVKRLTGHPVCTESSAVTNSTSASPCRMLTKHMSISRDPWSDDRSKSETRFARNPFGEGIPKDNSGNECAEVNRILSLSPPLPPKSTRIARPRPSPSCKMLSAPMNGSRSSSNSSSVSSRNGSSSSGSPRYSSLDESKSISGSDSICPNFSSHTDVSCYSSYNGEASLDGQGSAPVTEEKLSPLSPDSIFRRKSDPFADEFFLSLPKKTVNSANVNETQCTGNFETSTKDEQASHSVVTTSAT